MLLQMAEQQKLPQRGFSPVEFFKAVVLEKKFQQEKVQQQSHYGYSCLISCPWRGLGEPECNKGTGRGRLNRLRESGNTK